MVRVAIAPQFRWHLLAERRPESEALARELGLDPIVARALVHREIAHADAARAFLAPSLSELPDPTLLPDFEAAVAAVRAARERGTTVLVHGDYDVDGTCGSVLLHRLFERVGLESEVFVPDRVRDGYSFGASSLAAIRACGAGLVVAVDNGTTAYEPLAALAAEGVEVVVVDHHLPGREKPECAALLNPWCAPEGTLFPHFCGTGVAWLFAWGLLRELHGEDRLPDASRQFLYDALGLAAIATVRDVMPLRGPNRALVAEGLRAIGGPSFPGLAALAKVARIRGAPTSTDLGFRIAPRLNAAGRMGSAELAFRVLATRDGEEAATLATELDALNAARREAETHELDAIEEQVRAQLDAGDRVIFGGRSEARFGVLGIVANRVLDRTGLPALLWAECAPGVARGSARAPEGIDLVALLDAAAPELDGYGGHARAAGFHFDPARADAVAALLREAAAAVPAPPPPTLEVDGEVAPRELVLRVLEDLERLEPFGEQQREPRFLCRDMEVVATRPIGDGSHLELRLGRDGEVVRALGWRMASRLADLDHGDRVDVVFTAGVSDFRGRRSVEWTLADLQSAPRE